MTAAPEREIPDPGPRRRYGTRPFPAYRFVPGVHPHPIRDPAGHSYGQRSRAVRDDDFVAGVDLFNAHFFWEAHEAWEGLWAAQERSSPTALFLQGLIQIAAALLKTHMRRPDGARSLSRDGLAKLRGVAADTPSMMGVDLRTTIAAFETFFDAWPAAIVDAPQLVIAA